MHNDGHVDSPELHQYRGIASRDQPWQPPTGLFFVEAEQLLLGSGGGGGGEGRRGRSGWVGVGEGEGEGVGVGRRVGGGGGGGSDGVLI